MLLYHHKLLHILYHHKKYPRLIQRYQRFSLEHYIENNKYLSFCPSPGCSMVFEVDPGLIIEMECKCGYYSCSKCKQISHEPSLCEIAEKWLIKNSSESENIAWIIARTKKCPKCKIPIEKNQGCNHMKCAKCLHEFCWLCKGSWDEHGSITGGFYQCNVYDLNQLEGKIDDEEKEQQNAQDEIERYSFYYSRYDNHLRSGKLAKNKLPSYENRINNMLESRKWNVGDGEFILDAINEIIKCRTLLAWTYPISYYFPRKFKHLHLFEDLQQQLEKFTEHLHGLIEQKDLFNPTQFPKKEKILSIF